MFPGNQFRDPPCHKICFLFDFTAHHFILGIAGYINTVQFNGRLFQIRELTNCSQGFILTVLQVANILRHHRRKDMVHRIKDFLSRTEVGG